MPVAIIPLEAMPLTGVGKVFKPSLRWDASQRVFTKVLTPLKEKGVNYDVSVGAHGTHGSIATVTISGVPEAERSAIEAYVHGALDPFVLRHEVKWG